MDVHCSAAGSPPARDLRRPSSTFVVDLHRRPAATCAGSAPPGHKRPNPVVTGRMASVERSVPRPPAGAGSARRGSSVARSLPGTKSPARSEASVTYTSPVRTARPGPQGDSRPAERGNLASPSPGRHRAPQALFARPRAGAPPADGRWASARRPFARRHRPPGPRERPRTRGRITAYGVRSPRVASPESPLRQLL